MISLIAAVAQNDVIGREDGTIPWKLKSDMRYFKSVTMGKPMIMGRKTFDTFGGKLLPGRAHIVISRGIPKDLKKSEMEVFHTTRGAIITTARGELWVDNFECALIAANRCLKEDIENPEIMVIGGAQIYRQAIPYCTTMYLTTVYTSPEGEVKFPTDEIKNREWFLKSRSAFPASEENEHVFDFAIWQRHGKPTKEFLFR